MKTLPNGIAEKLWAKVIKTEACWLFRNKPFSYGKFLFDGKHWLAHRVSYILSNGPVPEGKVICHRCDNPGCVRPDHLFAGSHSENALDSISKGRFTIASRNRPHSKFPPVPNCECIGCGKAFYVAKCFLKRGKRFFCTLDCRIKNAPLALFWRRVKKSSSDKCWIWQGCRTASNYGVYSAFGERSAHRVSWRIHHNSLIPEGLVVRHKCDNPPCVNPHHLELGTLKENTQDMIARKRTNGPKGERAANHKLVTAEVALIKQLIIDGVANKQVGLIFGVHYMTINAIRKGHSWAHV